MVEMGIKDKFFWFESHILSNILLNKKTNKCTELLFGKIVGSLLLSIVYILKL